MKKGEDYVVKKKNTNFKWCVFDWGCVRGAGHYSHGRNHGKTNSESLGSYPGSGSEGLHVRALGADVLSSGAWWSTPFWRSHLAILEQLSISGEFWACSIRRCYKWWRNWNPMSRCKRPNPKVTAKSNVSETGAPDVCHLELATWAHVLMIM